MMDISRQRAIGLVVAVVVGLAMAAFFEASVPSGGVARPCQVDEIVAKKKNQTLVLRCDGEAHTAKVGGIASLVHGTPSVGDTITVLVKDGNDKAVWDKTLARHPGLAVLAMLGGFLVMAALSTAGLLRRR